MDPTAVLTQEEITGALADLKERLRSLLGSSLLKLALYGSRARGDAEPDSDVDVAVVIRGMDAATRDRVYRTVADVEMRWAVPLSTLILSEVQYNNLLARERRIARDIETEGVDL